MPEPHVGEWAVREDRSFRKFHKVTTNIEDRYYTYCGRNMAYCGRTGHPLIFARRSDISFDECCTVCQRDNV